MGIKTKTKNLDGWADDEEAKIEVNLDDEQGYITFIYDDYNETEIKFDWHVIEQLGLEMNRIINKE